jgi:DNA-binding NtrC family response regulator
VIRFQLPPLRERREEIPPLARHFLQRAAEEFRKGRLRLSDETMEYLLLHAGPGNVRQLSNEIRRMAALAEPDCILEPAALSPEVQASRRTVAVAKPVIDEITVRVDQSLPDALASIERVMVRRALENRRALRGSGAAAGDLSQGAVSQAAPLGRPASRVVASPRARFACQLWRIACAVAHSAT